MESQYAKYAKAIILMAAWLIVFNACDKMEVFHPGPLPKIIIESDSSTVIWESGKNDTVTITLNRAPECFSRIGYRISDPAQAMAVLDAKGSPILEWDPQSEGYCDTWHLPRYIIIEAVNDSLTEGDHTVYLYLDGGSFCTGLGSSKITVTIIDDD